ncbi:MAG: ferrochelatase [Planctomycetia bacterium]|nr:ferrochelatase [Planctomycetia bacterium]
MKYDSLLVYTYGGPETLDDVLPFLENITQGRGVAPHRLQSVMQHYEYFGGKSPLNDYTRRFLDAIAPLVEIPVYWGCRFASPSVEETIQRMIYDGIRRALVLIPSPFGGYNRIYFQKMRDLERKFGSAFPILHYIPPFSQQPRFWDAVCATLNEVATLRDRSVRENCSLVFSVHSLPVEVAKLRYEREARAAVEGISARLETEGFPGRKFLAWQSESKTAARWLEPRLDDVLREVATFRGCRETILVPIGFPFENMEVAYDLDVQARELGESLGLSISRAPTTGLHPTFLEMVRGYLDY